MSRLFRIGNSEIDIARSDGRNHATTLALICSAVALAYFTSAAKADEGGVSFWIPGFFGSLAAAPLQPGWSLQTNYYHTSVSAGADVARAREITIGRIPREPERDSRRAGRSRLGAAHLHVRHAGSRRPGQRRRARNVWPRQHLARGNALR